MSTLTRKLKIDGIPFCRYAQGKNHSILESFYTKRKTRGRNYYIQVIRNKESGIINLIRHKV